MVDVTLVKTPVEGVVPPMEVPLMVPPVRRTLPDWRFVA